MAGVEECNKSSISVYTLPALPTRNQSFIPERNGSSPPFFHARRACPLSLPRFAVPSLSPCRPSLEETTTICHSKCLCQLTETNLSSGGQTGVLGRQGLCVPPPLFRRRLQQRPHLQGHRCCCWSSTDRCRACLSQWGETQRRRSEGNFWLFCPPLVHPLSTPWATPWPPLRKKKNLSLLLLQQDSATLPPLGVDQTCGLKTSAALPPFSTHGGVSTPPPLKTETQC
jgi:hypothetical protein